MRAEEHGTADSRRMNEYDAKRILAAYSIPVTCEELVQNPDEALAAANRIGFPVAAKLVSGDIPHKTEAGAVILNLQNEAEVRRAFDTLMECGRTRFPEAALDGVLIQEMVSGRVVETIAGSSLEPPFGPAVVFGMGGIFVEVLKDVAIRVLPASGGDLESMVEEIRGASVLKGARGGKPYDLKAVTEVIEKLACLAWELRYVIAEIDMNPLMVREQGMGAVVADALILPRKQEGGD